MFATFQALEHTCLRTVDAVFTIRPNLRDYALRMSLAPEKHVLFKNSIFEDARLLRLRAAARDSAAPPVAKNPPLDLARPIVLSSGTFGHYQGIDVLIRAFASVVARRADAQLLLIGGTLQQVAHAATIVAEIGLDKSVHLTGRVSKSAAMRYTRQANVRVSPRRRRTNAPLKIYERLASGKPRVAARIWSHTRVLNETACILVEPGWESLAHGLVQVINDPDGAGQVAARARQMCERQYARPVYEHKIRRLLEIVS